MTSPQATFPLRLTGELDPDLGRCKLNLRHRVQAAVLAQETRLFAADVQSSRRDERPTQ